LAVLRDQASSGAPSAAASNVRRLHAYIIGSHPCWGASRY